MYTNYTMKLVQNFRFYSAEWSGTAWRARSTVQDKVCRRTFHPSSGLIFFQIKDPAGPHNPRAIQLIWPHVSYHSFPWSTRTRMKCQVGVNKDQLSFIWKQRKLCHLYKRKNSEKWLTNEHVKLLHKLFYSLCIESSIKWVVPTRIAWRWAHTHTGI